ncbi:MAG: hypothetical protein ASARMPRED_009320 [Alectoria sarmentosa]|nr:MAG: hypothetical protein ASARMPRED_009320 [Alectoria sarmentosa]
MPVLPADMAKPHAPAQIWSFRVPSPPRIIVPPPALNSYGVPDLHIVQDAFYDFESSGFKNAEFLQTVTYGNFMTINNMLEWKYEQRRMAQQILPFLYLGPMSAAKDRNFLQGEGITMVIAVRNTMSAQAKLLGSKAAQELGIDTKMIDVAGNQELIAAFPRAIEAINSHLSAMYQQDQVRRAKAAATGQAHLQSTPGKVLVFCESGNERSATLVTAYIMAMYATDLIKAIQIVQAQRFAVAFDDSLRNLLSTYEIILKAKRDVVQADNRFVGVPGGTKDAGASIGNDDGAGKRSKRTFDDTYDDDMEIDGGNVHLDYGRFEMRDGSAPFQDRPPF